MKKRNTLTIGDQVKSLLRHPGAGVPGISHIVAVITFALLFFLIGYILVKGIPYLNASLFSLTYTSENVSLLPSLINTLIMTLVSLADCRSGRNLCSDLPCGICKKRQPFCKADPYYRRDTFRYSIHRIWSVRYAVLCNCIALGHTLFCPVP